MKKLTLISIIVFVLIVGGIVVIKFLLPSASVVESINQTSNTNSVETGTPTVFTAEDVAKHNSAIDCYLIINNNVYSVALFIDKHPGGKDKIISNCGKEVTGIFTKIHTNAAWDLLAGFKVGTLAVSK